MHKNSEHYDFQQIRCTPYWRFCPEVQQICQPLFKQFAINYFDYSRFYPDNTSIALSSDPEYVCYLLTQQEYKCAAGLIVPGRHLWPSYINTEFMDKTHQRFDYYHGVTYMRQHKEYLELINFASAKKNQKTLEVFLNYTDALEYFILYFLKTIEPFLTKNKKSRVLLPPGFITSPPEKEEEPCSVLQLITAISHHSKLRKNTFLFKIGQQLITLTHRELQCLALLSRGMSTKQMARKLDISGRTAEAFCNKIMEKSGVPNRIELLSNLDDTMAHALQGLSQF